jgi:hypothetical protein
MARRRIRDRGNGAGLSGGETAARFADATYAANGRSAADSRLFGSFIAAKLSAAQAQDALLSDAGYDSLCSIMFGATR